MKQTIIDGIKIDVENCYKSDESFDGMCPFKYVKQCAHPGNREEFKHIDNIEEMPMKFCPLPEKEEYCPECGSKIEGNVCQGACKRRLL